MAVSTSIYDHTAKLFANKEIELSTLKVMLLDATASFTAANTTLNDVAGAFHTKEVDGNGWTTGGETVASVAVTQVTTNDAMLDGSNVVVTASGGGIGPALYAVLYDDTHVADAPLVFIDFGGSETAGDGTDFQIVWSSSGIISWTVA